MNIKTAILFLCILIQGCSKVDDYLLGQDNTPQPKTLAQIESKIRVAQRWSIPVGTSYRNTEYSKLQPTIKNAIIYTADPNGLIHAVNKHNGSILWSTQLKQGVVSGPTVHNGFVVVSTNASSIVALNQNDGKELWQANVSSQVLASPAVSHHIVVAKTIDGRVFAFDASSGKALWNVEHGSPNLILKASSAPIVKGDLVLIGFADGRLDAFELKTGRLMWQRSIAYSSGASDVDRLVDIDADPIIKHDIVYLASYQGYIGALSLANGEFIWKKPASVYKDMLLKNQTLFITDSHDVLWSVDSRSGTVNWKLTSLKARGLTGPVLVNHYLVVADKTGYVHFIDTHTGDLLGRYPLSSGVSTAPYAQGNILYVLTDNGMLNKLFMS